MAAQIAGSSHPGNNFSTWDQALAHHATGKVANTATRDRSVEPRRFLASGASPAACSAEALGHSDVRRCDLGSGLSTAEVDAGG